MRHLNVPIYEYFFHSSLVFVSETKSIPFSEHFSPNSYVFSREEEVFWVERTPQKLHEESESVSTEIMITLPSYFFMKRKGCVCSAAWMAALHSFSLYIFMFIHWLLSLSTRAIVVQNTNVPDCVDAHEWHPVSVHHRAPNREREREQHCVEREPTNNKHNHIHINHWKLWMNGTGKKVLHCNCGDDRWGTAGK